MKNLLKKSWIRILLSVVIVAVGMYFLMVKPAKTEARKTAETAAYNDSINQAQITETSDALFTCNEKLSSCETTKKQYDEWGNAREAERDSLQVITDSLLTVVADYETQLAELKSKKSSTSTTAGTTRTGTTPKSVIGKPAKGSAIQDDTKKEFIVRESDKNDAELIAKMPSGYTLKTVPR